MPQNSFPANCALISSVVNDSGKLTYNGKPITAYGFLFTVDGSFTIMTQGGQIIGFPAGVFQTGIQMVLSIDQIYNTGTTAQGYIFW